MNQGRNENLKHKQIADAKYVIKTILIQISFFSKRTVYYYMIALALARYINRNAITIYLENVNIDQVIPF